MGSNQSKPVRDPEAGLEADISPVLTVAKKRKAKDTVQSISESAAVTKYVPESKMQITKTSAYSTNGIDVQEKRPRQQERRNKLKSLNKPVFENVQTKTAESDREAIHDKARDSINVTTKQNSEPESKISEPEDKLIVEFSGEVAVMMNDSDKNIDCARADKQVETKGVHPSDDAGGNLDSHIHSAVNHETKTTEDILQTSDKICDDTVKRQGSPVHNDRSKDTAITAVVTSRIGSALWATAVAEETQSGASGNNSFMKQGSLVDNDRSKDTAITAVATSRIGSALWATSVAEETQNGASGYNSYSGIQATTSGNLPNPNLNYKFLSSGLSSSDLINTSKSSSFSSPVSSAALDSFTPCTTVLVSSATTNSYPSSKATIATASSGLSNIYPQAVNNSTQSFTSNENNHGNYSFSENNHGNFSFRGNNHENLPVSTYTVMTALSAPSITTSASNYNFPSSLTNYSRRNTQTNYNSDYMYATTITDSLHQTGGSTYGYPNWNALQTGIETDGAQVLINEAHLLNDERLARQLQNLLSTYNGNDYNPYDDYVTGYIENDNPASSRDDPNRAGLDGDYITVKTSVGDTTTRISAKNIKLSPQYRDGLTDENMGIILERPKYPRYATLASRIKSFEDLWPVTNQMSWEQLPEAGFVYTGTADCVRCYYCNGGLREWLKNDCAWTEHARYYPHCPHVRHCKGDEFIRTVRHGTDDAAYTHEEDSDNDMEVDAEAAGNNALRRDLEAMKVAADFITDRGLLDKAVYYLKTIQGKTSFDAQELAGVALEIEEGNIKVDSFPSTVEDLTEITEEPLRTKEDDNIDDLETDCVMLEEETRILKERSLCKVCLDATACVLFLECGHMIACPMCAPALKNCAVCRAEIKGTVRAQFATDR